MTSLEKQIIEIVYRGSSTVLGPDAHPSRIETVANPLSEAIVDLVVSAGNYQHRPPTVRIETYLVWELWNRILDEIEKEIPTARKIDVIHSGHATRAERRLYREGMWRYQISKPVKP